MCDAYGYMMFPPNSQWSCSMFLVSLESSGQGGVHGALVPWHLDLQCKSS